MKTVTIEVPEDKAEHLKTLSKVGVKALKIIADASQKDGMELKLTLAHATGQLKKIGL